MALGGLPRKLSSASMAASISQRGGRRISSISAKFTTVTFLGREHRPAHGRLAKERADIDRATTWHSVAVSDDDAAQRLALTRQTQAECKRGSAGDLPMLAIIDVVGHQHVSRPLRFQENFFNGLNGKQIVAAI